MDPITGAALITAGSSVLGSGINAYSQGKMNRKTRKWNEKMHGIVRAENLADYHMQNMYNSPEAQMQRFTDAGLNPHLIYGQQNEGATVRSADVASWNPEAPQIDLSGIGRGISQYFETRMQNQQIDNLKRANDVAIQQAALIAAQTAKTGIETDTSKFNLGMAEELRSTSLQVAEQNLRKATGEADTALGENERRIAMQASSLKEAAERILTARLQRAKTEDERDEIKQRIINLKKDQEIKQLEIDHPEGRADPFWWRKLNEIIGIDKIIDVIKYSRDKKSPPSPPDSPYPNYNKNKRDNPWMDKKFGNKR